jgi:uncharacterized protein
MPHKSKKSEILPMAHDQNSKALRVWLLIDDRPGHATQVKGLAQAMGWKSHLIVLKFNFLNRLPNPFLGATLLSTTGLVAKKLQPPYPNIVVGMGRRIVPVARWIKKQSGGSTRIVLLGRKAVGKASDIDYAVSCVHFNQLPRENFFELVVPPTQVNRESLVEAREVRPNPIESLSHPRVVLLVGGPTAQHFFDETDAGELASKTLRAVNELGGGLAIVTSRRTPGTTVAAMRSAASGAYIHEWQIGVTDNPYLSYLSHADLLAVTGESESMIAEAAATGLPLTICPLREKPYGIKSSFAKLIRRNAEYTGLMAAVCRYLLFAGWIVPPRDLSLMHTAMIERGLAYVFDGSLNTQKPEPSHEFEHLANELATRMAGQI